MQVTDENCQRSYTDLVDENRCQMNTCKPVIDSTKCTACGDCVAACPVKAVTMQAEQTLVIDDVLCSYCGECEDICPAGAISLPVWIRLAPDTQKER